MELGKGQLGSEAKFDIEVKAGEVLLSLEYAGHQARAKLEGGVSVDVFLDKLAAKIPGVFDDALINVAKAALKAL